MRKGLHESIQTEFQAMLISQAVFQKVVYIYCRTTHTKQELSLNYRVISPKVRKHTSENIHTQLHSNSCVTGRF